MGQGPGTQRINAQRKAAGKERAEKWFKLRARCWSNSEIARHFGVAESTVSQAITRYMNTPIEGLETVRRIENQKLDASEKRVRQTMESGDLTDSEHVVRCEHQLLRIRERRAKLNGIDMPVKVDPDLVVSTVAATTAAVAASAPAAPAVQIILSSDPTKPEGG